MSDAILGVVWNQSLMGDNIFPHLLMITLITQLTPIGIKYSVKNHKIIHQRVQETFCQNVQLFGNSITKIHNNIFLL